MFYRPYSFFFFFCLYGSYSCLILLIHFLGLQTLPQHCFNLFVAFYNVAVRIQVIVWIQKSLNLFAVCPWIDFVIEIWFLAPILFFDSFFQYLMAAYRNENSLSLSLSHGTRMIHKSPMGDAQYVGAWKPSMGLSVILVLLSLHVSNFETQFELAKLALFYCFRLHVFTFLVTKISSDQHSSPKNTFLRETRIDVENAMATQEDFKLS